MGSAVPPAPPVAAMTRPLPAPDRRYRRLAAVRCVTEETKACDGVAGGEVVPEAAAPLDLWVKMMVVRWGRKERTAFTHVASSSALQGRGCEAV